MSEREELADLIYTTLQGEQWLPTADGTGNVASHILADAILAAGWRPHMHDGRDIHDPCSICGTTFWKRLLDGKVPPPTSSHIKEPPLS